MNAPSHKLLNENFKRFQRLPSWPVEEIGRIGDFKPLGVVRDPSNREIESRRADPAGRLTPLAWEGSVTDCIMSEIQHLEITA